jgi:hypothetical protein
MTDAPKPGDLAERLALWMISHSYATGHGDTIEDLLGELEGQVDERIWRAEAARDEAVAERDKAIAEAKTVVAEYRGKRPPHTRGEIGAIKEERDAALEAAERMRAALVDIESRATFLSFHKVAEIARAAIALSRSARAAETKK